ncbi:MAG TPA: tRNA preQ1(34) S-adenosylmethionine ribosyltransferase-isomerase QueA [Alphaproteobacteria bacterium]|nr:tRNA preQ1(34) S-adenosylmethionine ribosyltransferase-isomerase QueA [Alphaproteobacteria bacterium]
MKVSDFDFELPRELIATHPAEPREAAKLLEIGERLTDRIVRDLPSLLNPGDIVVVNDTKVIPARLAGKRGAAKVEVTLHKRESDSCWRAFAKGARKLKLGDTVDFASDFTAKVVEKGEDGEVVIDFDRGGPELMAALAQYGFTPLPPYIARPDGPDARDREDYQTVFARHEGAVAAPTAGLHFTPLLLDALKARGIQQVTLTLHVGAGTFLPVKVEDTADHKMHAEIGIVSQATADAINQARAKGGRALAVGTTVTRTLESAADDKGIVHPFSDETRLFITPGYRFKAIDLLLTNFHLPRSTLFMLVSAFAGLERMKAAYDHAIAARYRFYSYGDCCLLHPAAGARIQG